MYICITYIYIYIHTLCIFIIYNIYIFSIYIYIEYVYTIYITYIYSMYIQYIFRLGVFEDFFGFLPSPWAGSQLPWVDSDHQDRQAGWI